jgi:DNA mismatch repair ATPase MutS
MRITSVEITEGWEMGNCNEQMLAEKNEIFEPMIQTNERKNFIRLRGHQGPAKLSRKLYLQLCPPSVIDIETLKLIQVLRLHKAIDNTVSCTGSAVLLRSLVQPSTDLDYIRSKQESLKEIASNAKLRQALQECVHEYSKGESALYKFFNKDLYAMFPYRDLKRAKKSAANIVRVMQSIPGAESSYLGGLMASLKRYEGSSIDQMMKGSIYKTFKGLKSAKEVGIFTPKLKFIPHRFSKWIFAGPLVALAPYVYNKIGFEPSLSPLMSTIGLVWTGLYVFYSLIVKPVKDTGNFIEPFRKRCIDDKAFSRAVDAVGMIDELLSCHRYAIEWPHTATLPLVTDGDHHCFEATGLKNPLLAEQKPDCVPNDVQMNGARLSFISGPNSGGKTTICKSIVQNQLLAQIGSYVLAEKASINIADTIRYQAPKFDGLQDDEGRFGTELSRTRDIFYSTSPKSLIILDELAEGTTYEERLHESFGILNDFHTIGNNTILVTHNHSLVDSFTAEKRGQCLMAEFKSDVPTYRIIPGLSRVSHADRIAKKINFSQEDRHQYMKEKGYL